MLEINLLGKFDIRLDGQAVEISSRPAQSLLAYLLLKPGTVHRREKLAGLLWPDATETNARGYLRQALWRVRKALQNGSEEFILADDLTIAFNAQSDFRLDVAGLEKEVRATASTEALTQSVACYQGELLPGFYEEWAVLERGRLQAVYEAKMKQVLERLAVEQRWPDLLEWAERWIALGHAPEPAYRALMLAHHSLGDRASMAAAYQRCEETLRRELNVAPSESTRALFARLSSSAPRGSELKETAPAEPETASALIDRKRRFARVVPAALPRQLTSFVGREREIAAVKALLDDPASRLVTLTGVGGCGKTRLSLQVSQALAPRYPHGVWFVELATLTDPALVPQRVATTLGLLDEPGRPILMTLTSHLRAKTSLVILDNCEHLIDASAALVETLLRACPNLHIVASSRETLGIPGEMIFRVPSLSVPDAQPALSAEALVPYEAVQLFVDRATSALPGFTLTDDNAAAIAQICRRLDGIPLAIELAAARVRMLSVQQIASRLTDRFRLLTGGSRTVLPRQQTLRATMDWSYNLLPAAERQLFDRLSVFACGWTLEAAETVCELASADSSPAPLEVLELLTQLVNKSLVSVEPSSGGATRYRLLETLRQYVREKLFDTGAGAEVRSQHLAYFLALAKRAEPALTGPDQIAWLNRLEEEFDNLRAALEWALESNVPAGLELVTAVGRFWDAHDYSREGSLWLKRLLEQPEAGEQPDAQARAWNTLSMLYVTQGEFSQAQAAAETGQALCHAQGDTLGEAFSHMLLGEVASMQGDIVLANRLLNESLDAYQALGNRLGQADALTWLSTIDHRDTHRSRALLEASLAITQELGHLAGIASNLASLAQQVYWEGDYVQPLPWLEEAMRLQRQLGSKSGMAWVLELRGNLALRQGNYEQAQSYFAESLALSEAAGQRNYWPLANQALIAVRQGAAEQAQALYADVIRRFQEGQIQHGLIYCVEGLITLAAARNQPERAARLLGWADTMRNAIGDARPPGEQIGLEQDLAAARVQLPASFFAENYAAGQTLTMDEAVALALAPVAQTQLAASLAQ
jgi:predicted ATPase/DNA-binding SARP family transcriptional activator